MSGDYKVEGGVRVPIKPKGGNYDTDEQLRRKKFDSEHDQKMGASGIGGARKRTPQYLKDRDAAYAKASASGWGNQ